MTIINKYLCAKCNIKDIKGKIIIGKCNKCHKDTAVVEITQERDYPEFFKIFEGFEK